MFVRPPLPLLVFALLPCLGCPAPEPEVPHGRLMLVNLHRQPLDITELSGVKGVRFPTQVLPGDSRDFTTIAVGKQKFAYKGPDVGNMTVDIETQRIVLWSTPPGCWVVARYDGMYGGKKEGVEILAHGKGEPVFAFNAGGPSTRVLAPGQPLPSKKPPEKSVVRVNAMPCGALPTATEDTFRAFALPLEKQSTQQ